MNKPFNLLLAALLLTGCHYQEDDFFDKSAAERRQGNIDAVRSELIAASAEGNNGWVLQYFVSGTDDTTFPGFNVMAGFNANGTVTMGSDHSFLRNGNAGKYTEASSVFNMSLEDGPILSFNTWNDVFSVLNDPVNPAKAPTVIEQDGVGMGGDNNLVIMSHSSDEMILRGERYSAYSRLVRCDRPWQQYLSDCKTMQNSISNTEIPDYYITDGTSILELSGLNSGVITVGEVGSDKTSRSKYPCVFTPTGFRTNRSVVFASGKSFQEMSLSKDRTMLVSPDGDVKIMSKWDRYFVTNEMWLVDATTLSADQQALCSQIDTLVKAKYPKLTLRGIAIGKSKGRNAVNGIVLVFYKNEAKLTCISAGMAMDKSLVAYSEMKMASAADVTYDYNMQLLISQAPRIADPVKTLAASFENRYTLTPDDYFMPKVMTLTSASGTAYKASVISERSLIE